MKKLGKKFYQLAETVEAYACDCSGNKCAYPTCSCPYGDSSAGYNQKQDKHMDENNYVYSSTSNRRTRQ